MMMYLVGVALIVVVAGVILLRLYISSGAKCTLDTNLDGKIVIITGGNSGIGKVSAIELARRGARVIIGCRNKVKAEAAVTLIRRRTGSDAVHYLPLDLASFQSVQEFVDMFMRQFSSAYALINNAAYLGPKKKSRDRYDLCFQVNYLSHYYLTQLLIHKLSPDQTRPLRVINVVSDSYARSAIDFDDLLMDSQPYDMYEAYGRTKLELIWFTAELNYRYWDSAVTAVPVHPGAVYTNLLRNWPGVKGELLRLVARLLFRSPEIGAQSIVHCILIDSLEDYIGKLVCDCKPVPLASIAKDHRKAERLWDISWDMCPLDDLKMKMH